LDDVGYQALPLADSYDQGRIFKATAAVGFLYVEAATAGSWANGSDPKTGLYVKVLPGAKPGTKKFEIYEDNALVETIDNLSDDPTSDDYYPKRIGGAGNAQLSQYITIKYINSPGGAALHAANTANGWNATATPAMPTGKINAGGSTGGSFANGFNGETAQYSDYVGTIDPAADTLTGIKAFEDADNIEVDVICAPGMTDISGSIAVHQELARVAKKVNAIALIDVPAGLNARQAVDWHNGAGLYAGRGRLDSANVACYWNWFDTTDPFTTNVRKTVPPTLGALRCLAFTFDHDKPWYAAAGDVRGLIPEALTVEFTKVSADAKAGMYGQGQSINPILLDRGQIKLFGERTMQVAESKLSVVHNVVLVDQIVNNMSRISRRFVFEPNDPELLVRLRLALSQFLDKVKNERGIETYNLVLDDSNNNADSRNRREVIVDLDVVPIDAVERIFINAVVRQSGAELQNVT
jgi:phage tail sheath protein FI